MKYADNTFNLYPYVCILAQLIVYPAIGHVLFLSTIIIEPRNEISNKVVCATNKASDQPAHMHSLIRAFASRLNIL